MMCTSQINHPNHLSLHLVLYDWNIFLSVKLLISTGGIAQLQLSVKTSELLSKACM